MKSKNWLLVKLSSLIIILSLVLGACADDEADGDTKDTGNAESAEGNEVIEGTEDTEDTEGNEDAADTPKNENVTYLADVQDIITNSCISCHGDSSPTMAEFDEDADTFTAMMKGPRLDTYEHLTVIVNGPEAGALMRRLDNGENKEDGEPGNMYQYLGATDEEREERLEVFKEWVGHWILKRENELTDEDHEKFKLQES